MNIMYTTLYTKMVKNFGGNKAKGFARKSFANNNNNELRISQEDAEVYAQVTKVFGGKMCQVTTLNDTIMLCHIRGKFTGKGKRDNFIGNGTWMLVGKREWETEKETKMLNCDVIEVYNENDKIKLKNNITNINWNKFIIYEAGMSGNGNKNENNEVSDIGFSFGDEKTQEYQAIIEAQIKASKTGGASTIDTDDGDIINVDDI